MREQERDIFWSHLCIVSLRKQKQFLFTLKKSHLDVCKQALLIISPEGSLTSVDMRGAAFKIVSIGINFP